MVRRYDSSRRKKAAEQTRKDILHAALRLHWRGVTEFEPLAREAGCSVATVRKHFPTKETLFENCTATFGETLIMPDLVTLSQISDPRKRLRQSVSEMCRIHEAMFGYAWLSARLRDDSAVLDTEMKNYERLADAIAGLVISGESPRARSIRGLLDFLTYRALRLSAKLSPAQVSEELVTTISALMEATPQWNTSVEGEQK